MLQEQNQEQKFDVLLFDVSNLFHRSFAAISYANKNGIDFSGLVGTIQTMESQLRKHQPSIAIAVFDGKGGSKKKRKIFEGYKEGRKIPIKLNEQIKPSEMKQHMDESRENFLFQQKRLTDYLAALPIYVLILEGYEADEIIAQLVQKNFSDKSCLIVSGDKDFQQLISPRVSTFYLHDKKIHGLKEMEETWGVNKGNNVLMVRLFEGDGSDKIPGLHGYGKKTLLKYFPMLQVAEIKDLEDLKIRITATRDLMKFQKEQKNWKTVVAKCDHILEGFDKKETTLKCWDILERNYKLMQLQNPEINIEAKIRIDNALTKKPLFNSRKIKELTYQDHIELRGHQFPQWEFLWKQLTFNK